MNYLLLGVTVFALLGVVLLLSGCITTNDKNDSSESSGQLSQDVTELDTSLEELDAIEASYSDDISSDFDSFEDNTLSNDETSLDSEMSELETTSDEDIQTDLESLEDLN